jgi:hypothetical protein
MPHQNPPAMDLTPAPAILEVLGAVDIEDWRCVAELTDNALDNFRKYNISPGIIHVALEGDWLVIGDNGTGMTHSQCENALKAGYSDKSKNADLGLFGVGFNVACARLGTVARVFTKPQQETEWLMVELDLARMRRTKSFHVQPEYVSNPEFGESPEYGTIVAVKLRPDMKIQFSRSRHMKEISDRLGDIYSFILREQVPGLTGQNAGEPREVEIIVDNERIKPHLPCIWSESRTIKYRGADVPAVQKFQRTIGDGWLCQDCGHWHDRDPGAVCEECAGETIECIERRVWGWIGLGRYLHETDYGIDFIRNGRKILLKDKEIFKWRDPNSGAEGNEYPVEMPANRGRIVGEVHCDHVPVDFRKTGFQQSRIWDGAKGCVRGSQPLRPRSGKGEQNDSPLANIFSGFRRNDPGLRSLIPGDGVKANHERAKNWGEHFHNGDAEYLEDTKWYEAARYHDDRKNGATDGNPPPTPSPAPPTPPTATPVPPDPGAPSPPGPLSDRQRMERWEKGGRQRHDLSTDLTLPNNLGSWALRVWETSISLSVDRGKNLATVCIAGHGNTLHIYVDEKHDTFKKYGRRKVDLLLFEAASVIKALKNSPMSVSEIFGYLLNAFPDEEESATSTKSQIEELTQRLRLKFRPIVSADPKRYWTKLDDDNKRVAEENAAASTDVVWEDAVRSGDYVLHLSLEGIRKIVCAHPEDFFGGKLFKQYYPSSHAEAAQIRALGQISEALINLAQFRSLHADPFPHEVRLSALQMQYLNESIEPDPDDVDVC